MFLRKQNHKRRVNPGNMQRAVLFSVQSVFRFFGWVKQFDFRIYLN